MRARNCIFPFRLRRRDILISSTRYAEEDPSILGSTENPIHVLGFCTGEIPAAVAVAARNNTELYELSLETIHIIFRFARDCWRRTVLVDQRNESWATTLVGVTPGEVQTILDEFHCSQVSDSELAAFVPPYPAWRWLTLDSRAFPLRARSTLDLRPRDGLPSSGHRRPCRNCLLGQRNWTKYPESRRMLEGQSICQTSRSSTSM